MGQGAGDQRALRFFAVCAVSSARRVGPHPMPYEIFFIDFTLLRAVEIPCFIYAERRRGCGCPGWM